MARLHPGLLDLALLPSLVGSSLLTDCCAVVYLPLRQNDVLTLGCILQVLLGSVEGQLLLCLDLALVLALRLLLPAFTANFDEAAKFIELQALSVGPAWSCSVFRGFGWHSLLAGGALRPELRNIELRLLGQGLLVHLLQRQAKTLILASVLAIQILEEHWVVQLLLLQLHRELLLLGPGVGLHHLDLFLLIVVGSARLAPVRRRLVALRHQRALVRLALALLRGHDWRGALRFVLPRLIRAERVRVCLLVPLLR